MHIAFHNATGICLWDLLGVAALLAAAVVLAVHFIRRKRYFDENREDGKGSPSKGSPD